jgi:hypothetical protein
LSRVNAENRNRHGDRQFAVVAGGCKGEGGSLGLSRPAGFAQEEACQEHNHEVDQQWYGDEHHIHRRLGQVSFRMSL